jgi:hypothetical protein
MGCGGRGAGRGGRCCRDSSWQHRHCLRQCEHEPGRGILARTSVQNVVINSVSLDARLHSAVVNLAQMAVTARGATLNARGTVGIIPHTVMRLAYAMRVQNASLRCCKSHRSKGDGELDLTGTANGSLLGADAPGLRAGRPEPTLTSTGQ